MGGSKSKEMGGVNSACLPLYQNPNETVENHSKVGSLRGSLTSTPKSKISRRMSRGSHRRNLSAVFNMADMATDEGIVMEQLNINTATEEELMTLPGINRDTAHNIVEYRKQIGSFKKVEDLALVSRVGATKLNHIRNEICVGRKKSSQSSSQSSSRNDLSLMDSISRASARSNTTRSLHLTRVNVNTSNVFQLMKLRDMTQIIAENIVIHRDKKGPFRTLDSLVKVKGINNAVLSAIRPYLILDDSEKPDPPPVITPSYNGLTLNGSKSHSLCSRTQSYTNGTTPHYNAALTSMLATGINSNSQEDLLNMYGPISRKSFRANKLPPLFKLDGQPLIRVATWNMEDLGDEKVENPGVKEVLSMTSLEHGWSVLALQGLTSPHALNKVADEMNHPTLPNVKRWIGRRGCWKVAMSENVAHNDEPARYRGFLYDASQDVELLQSSILQPSADTQGNTTAFVAQFKVRNLDMVLVNVVMSRNLDVFTMQDLSSCLHEHLIDCPTDNIVILGDVSQGDPNKVIGAVEPLGYTCLQCGRASTDSHSKSKSVQLLSLKATANLNTVRSGVVEDGLCSPWIPDGWKWGGPVSGHAPLWCEITPSAKFHLADSSSIDYSNAQQAGGDS